MEKIGSRTFFLYLLKGAAAAAAVGTGIFYQSFLGECSHLVILFFFFMKIE
jgi:hypothetical protein